MSIRTIKDPTHPIVFYHADLTRAKSVILGLLRSFKGWLHCDGYVAYKDLPNVTIVGPPAIYEVNVSTVGREWMLGTYTKEISRGFNGTWESQTGRSLL